MSARAAALEPFTVLFDDESAQGLPDVFAAIYGPSRPLAGDRPRLFANFVESIDGVVALADGRSSGSVISGRSPADRFVMGLLRAQADAVLMGAGTLRDSAGHRWTAEAIFPALAGEFAAWRREQRMPATPRLALVTASGRVGDEVASMDEVTVFTTPAGARELPAALRDGDRVRVLGGAADHVDVREVVATLRAEGCASILTEAGPTINAQLIRDGLIDDLFVTVSPVIAGRNGAQKGLAEGVTFLPDAGVWTEMVSCRRHGSYLFVRYRLPKAS